MSITYDLGNGLKLVWQEASPDVVTVVDGYKDECERGVWSLTDLTRCVEHLNAEREKTKDSIDDGHVVQYKEENP